MKKEPIVDTAQPPLNYTPRITTTTPCVSNEMATINPTDTINKNC